MLETVQESISEVEWSLLQRSSLLDAVAEPELDRWTHGLRRRTRASVAALALTVQGRCLIKSLSADDVAGAEVVELESGQGPEEWLRARAGAWADDGAYLEAPVTVEGLRVGVVCVADRHPHNWAEAELEALENAAAGLATVLSLMLLRERYTRVQGMAAAHNRIHDLIIRGTALPEVLAELVHSVEQHEPSIRASVVLADTRTSTLHLGAGPSLPEEYQAAIEGVPIGPNIGACGSAAWSGQLTICEDIATDPRWAPIRDFALGFGLRHCWSMPIKALGGVVLGTLAFYGDTPRRPLPPQITLMDVWARLAGIAIERHNALDRLVQQARFDMLTGLPNRPATFEALDRALERAEPESQVAVMFVDLDGLKTLNDTLGHDRADEMLREVGERLAATVRGEDFVGRIGGDEFVVVAEGVTREEEAAALARRLLDVISRPLPGIDGTVVTASIGVGLMAEPGIDAREAIRQADAAMYEAKRSGRDRCVFFTGARRVHEGRRLMLARELRDVEKRGELSLVFQPVVSVAGGEIIGVEALLRWNSPRFGSVPPAEFIPIAEDTGAIVAIGAWVLRESCEIMARVVEAMERPLELSVNVSAHQVSHPGFALSVQRTLSHAEFPAHLLTLEITETALLRPDAVTARTLRELEDIGVRTALDDFGTGFSSLSWLKEHPLAAIKIDRSFVNGIVDDAHDQAVVAAVVGLARALGCTVTAEGVEREDQLAALAAMECERSQGFLLARPLPVDDLMALLGTPGALPRRAE